jgi:hypothetical protein
MLNNISRLFFKSKLLLLVLLIPCSLPGQPQTGKVISAETNIEYHRPRKVTLGNPIETNNLRSGFSNNDLGSEFDIKMNARKKVLLKDINLDVAFCTYDSVT